MDALEALVKQHKWSCNRNRTNMGECMFYKERKCLIKGIYSNTRRQGPVLEAVQAMLGPEISAVCLNKDCVCPPHRDRSNCGASWIAFFGDYTSGGDLVLEDGTRFPGDEKAVWHGPFLGASTTHWNVPHEGGTKISVVAFKTKPRAA